MKDDSLVTPRRGAWKRFALDEEIMSDFPRGMNFPGTYVIANNKKPIYIGQSNNIRRRLKTHIRLSYFQSNWCTPWGSYKSLVIAIRRERFRYERLAIEKRLIVKFNPPFNNLLTGKKFNNEK